MQAFFFAFYFICYILNINEINITETAVFYSVIKFIYFWYGIGMILTSIQYTHK